MYRPYNVYVVFLQVFKASYGVSIRINDIKRYIDVSAIQPFLINSRPIFFLHSRGKSTLPNRPKCVICEGHVKKSEYKFCSIACKVRIILEIFVGLNYVKIYHILFVSLQYRFAVEPIYPDPDDHPSDNTIMPSIDHPSHNTIMPSNGSEAGEEVLSNIRKRRKGIPHRSPIKQLAKFRISMQVYFQSGAQVQVV